MTYTARELISNSYKIAGIVARELQWVTGQQAKHGLSLLNKLLAGKSYNEHLIPFFTSTTFNTVIGQEKYVVNNLISVQSLTVSDGNIRYSANNVSRKPYFGSSKSFGYQAIPFDYHVEKDKGGCDVYFHELPAKVYSIEIWGKYSLSEVPSLDFDMSTVYDLGYIDYFEYLLAQRICCDYKITMAPQAAEELNNLKSCVTLISPIDLSPKRRNRFAGNRNYSDRDQVIVGA